MRAARAAALAAAALTLAACSGGGSSALTDPDDIPPAPKGASADVSVCRLVPAAQATAALNRPLEVVGVQYGASRVPTYRCELGEEFGVSQLTVELAVGPIARNVFEGAYGDAAGGDPQPLKRLGSLAYARTERDERSVHIWVHGSILSLRLQRDPANPIPRHGLRDLAHVALNRLPRNPRLARTSLGDRCSQIDPAPIAGVIGAVASRAAGLSGSDGSLTCSWASFPGSVDVVVVSDPARVRDYRRTLDRSLYVSVRGLGADVRALSRANRPGDLIVFDGTQSLAQITVIPAAGYPDNTIVTTPAEIALARQVVSRLL